MSSNGAFPRVRDGTIEDSEIITEYNIRMAKETEDAELKPDVVLAGVNTCLTRSDLGVYYLVEVQEGIVGQLRMEYEWCPLEGRFSLWIQSVYVHPDHRKRGYYRMLYNRVREEGKKIGALSIKLYADYNNDGAKQMYRKLGMKEGGKVYGIGDGV